MVKMQMVLMEELYGMRKPLSKDELKFYDKVNQKEFKLKGIILKTSYVQSN
jgi:hypothetical protein